MIYCWLQNVNNIKNKKAIFQNRKRLYICKGNAKDIQGKKKS